MAVDYEEGRRLLASAKAWSRANKASESYDAESHSWAVIQWENWISTNAEALLNPDPWRPISEADGQIKRDEVIVDLWAEGNRYPECWWSGKRWVSYIAGNSGDLPANYEAQLYEISNPTHFREIKGPGQ